MEVKVTRRYQITIPKKVRRQMSLSVGDVVEVEYEDGRIVIEKVGDGWEDVMVETSGAWKDHPVFGKMRDSLEIVKWLRGER